MHDFDVQQRKRQQEITEEFGDHPFSLRGEVFRVSRNIPYVALKDVASVGQESSDADAFRAIEQAVLGMISGGEDDRLRFLRVCRENTEFPVTYSDLLEIYTWMLEEATSLPPTRRDSSSGSSSTNGEASTAGSSTERAAASKG